MGKDELGKSEVVSWEEMITSNTIQIEAILRLLESKGIINSDEYINEVKLVNEEMQKKIKDSSTQN
jgi:hypothetical protein